MSTLEIQGKHARFVVEREFRCSAESLWPWLTEPARIACWSSAPVQMHGAFERGARRVVTIRLGPLSLRRLHEEIVEVVRPAGFAYCGCSIAGHRGRVSLSEHGPATQLCWSAEFVAPLSAFAYPMASLVQHQLADSLRRLAERLAS